jgi:hypothetical protein
MFDKGENMSMFIFSQRVQTITLKKINQFHGRLPFKESSPKNIFKDNL